MKKYPSTHWKALGDWISLARHQAGYSDTKEWAQKVGRTSRVLLGLERGEPVGPKTIDAVAVALGVANWSLFEVLDSGGNPDWIARSDAEVEAVRTHYETETGLEADAGGERGVLYMFSDQELLDELGRRLATRPWTRSERRLRGLQSPEVSEADGTIPDLAAAHDEEVPVSGEQGEPETP